MVRNRVFERIDKRRAWLEQQLIEYWQDTILMNSDRDDTVLDLQNFIKEYFQKASIDQLEDDNIYLDLPEFEG